jgi:hypothetical protein
MVMRSNAAPKGRPPKKDKLIEELKKATKEMRKRAEKNRTGEKEEK